MPEHFDATRHDAGIFRGRAEHRAEADVIGAVLFGFPCLFEVMRRNADDFLPHEFSTDLEWKVILTEMHAVGVTSQSNVDTIVDDQLAFIGSGRCSSAPRELKQITAWK